MWWWSHWLTNKDIDDIDTEAEKSTKNDNFDGEKCTFRGSYLDHRHVEDLVVVTNTNERWTYVETKVEKRREEHRDRMKENFIGSTVGADWQKASESATCNQFPLRPVSPLFRSATVSAIIPGTTKRKARH